MKRKFQRWAPFVLVVALLAGALGLAQWRRVDVAASPNALLYMLADTQRELTRLPVAFAPLSDSEEIRIGNGLAKRYAPMTADTSTDPQIVEVRRYVEAVGASLAAHAHRNLPYRFHYIPSSYFINAFALPGGHVYIGAGLLALMKNEDELAAVLGHEIEHIDHGHAAERVQMEAALRGLPLGRLLAIPVEVFEAGYTKDEELEADREGTRLAVAAGYSPEGAIQMFQAYQELERQLEPAGRATPTGPVEELSQVSIEMLIGYFRSHPADSDRIAQLRRLIREENWNINQPERSFAVAYIFLAERANRALIRRDYKLAADLAAQSLSQHPGFYLALSALAQADIALGNYGPANDAYRQLVNEHPAEAAAIAGFTDRLTDEALYSRNYSKAQALARESLTLQPGRPSAMASLAKAELGLGNLEGAAETLREIQKIDSSAALVANVLSYAVILEDSNFTLGHFDYVARYASFRLQFAPAQPQALFRLAEALYASGNFVASAAAFRGLLDTEIQHGRTPINAHLTDFSQALAAAHLGAKAVALFQDFLSHLPAEQVQSPSIQVEMAGLQLLAGNGAAASALAGRPGIAATGGFPPEFLARLGFWYYRAGDYAMAERLLRQAAALRPGNAVLENDFGWVELERGDLADAIRRFTLAEDLVHWFLVPPLWDAPSIGRAIARWRLKQTDNALRDFQPAIDRHSPWLNQAWVSAVFTPGVAGTVSQLQQEWQKREDARRKFYPPVRHGASRK